MVGLLTSRLLHGVLGDACCAPLLARLLVATPHKLLWRLVFFSNPTHANNAAVYTEKFKLVAAQVSSRQRPPPLPKANAKLSPLPSQTFILCRKADFAPQALHLCRTGVESSASNLPQLIAL